MLDRYSRIDRHEILHNNFLLNSLNGFEKFIQFQGLKLSTNDPKRVSKIIKFSFIRI